MDQFIKGVDSDHTVYAVIEVQKVKEIAPENLNSTQALYHMNSDNLSTGYNFFVEQEDSENANRFLKAYAKYALKSSILVPQLLAYFRPNYFSREHKADLGYLSLEKQSQLTKSKSLIARRKAFQDDTSAVLRRREILLNENKQAYESASPSVIRRYNSLIALGKEHNVEIIFIKPPRALGVKAIYEALDHPLKVDLSDPVKYPEFYRVEHSFDAGHFTESGAKLFSEVLATELKQLINKKRAQHQ